MTNGPAGYANYGMQQAWGKVCCAVVCLVCYGADGDSSRLKREKGYKTTRVGERIFRPA